MRSLKNSLLMALFAIFGTSCSNTEEVEMLVDNTPTESVMKSRSAGIDYSSLELLPKRTVMPRVGESYTGSITYRDHSYPIGIFWNFDYEDYNMYAYIGGEIRESNGNVYTLAHMNTYKSASNESQLNFVIQCIYMVSYMEERRYVTFEVSYNVLYRECSCTVLEDTTERWPFVD